MKKIIQVTCLILALGIGIPLSAKNAKSVTSLKVNRSTVDFRAYNSTSSTAWVYLYNTVTQTGEYYNVPANTGSNGVVIGQIDENNDIYTGTVQMNDNSYRTIRLYHTQDFNVNTLNATDLAIGCGACAEVVIN